MKEYRIDPVLRWAAQANGLSLASDSDGVSRTIAYPAAALWDFVARGYGFERSVRMLRYIGGFADDDAAAVFVSHQLDEWFAAGLLTREER